MLEASRTPPKIKEFFIWNNSQTAATHLGCKDVAHEKS